MKPYSLLRRITAGLTATMVVASLCAFGWLYIKTKWTDIVLREQTLLDQAQVIVGYLTVNKNGSVELDLPPHLAEAYISANSPYRYAVRDTNGQFLINSGAAVAPLPAFGGARGKIYDYDPDGTGPLHVFGAALQTVVGHRTLFVQVERQAQESSHLREAALDRRTI